MVLSTCGADGQPQSRNVTCHEWSEEGFVFCSNYEGPKARQLEENNKAAALFRWPETMRQVRITGVVHKVTRDETLLLFRRCSRTEQVCFYALSQGKGDRFNQSNEEHTQEARIEHLQGLLTRYMLGSGEVPLPKAWGGFRIVPDTIEFLDARANWTLRTLYQRTLRVVSSDDETETPPVVDAGEWQRKYLVP